MTTNNSTLAVQATQPRNNIITYIAGVPAAFDIYAINGNKSTRYQVDINATGYEFLHCYPFKTYKTLKGLLNFINKLSQSHEVVEIYVSPFYTDKVPSEWVESAQSVTDFIDGNDYIADCPMLAHKGEVTFPVSRHGKGRVFSDAENRSMNVFTVTYSKGIAIATMTQDYGIGTGSYAFATIRADQPVETVEITTQGEITESDVNFTDGEWDITPTPDGSDEPTDSGTPTPASESTHTTLKSAVALHFNAARATKSQQAYYLAFYRKLAKCNSCTLEICGEMVTITRLEKGDFAVSAQSQPVAPQPEMPAPAPEYKSYMEMVRNGTPSEWVEWIKQHPITERDFATFKRACDWKTINRITYYSFDGVEICHHFAGHDLNNVALGGAFNKYIEGNGTITPDWHTIIDDIAISDFNLIDSSEWANLISEAEIAFDTKIETERNEIAIDDYNTEHALERNSTRRTPPFELLATKAPVKPKKATRARFVQITPMLFDTPKITAKDIIAHQLAKHASLQAQRKAHGDRLPPAPLFDRGI